MATRNGFSGRALTAAVLVTLAGGPAATLASPTLTTLVSFNGTNGSDPEGELLLDGSGNLYGTAGGPNYGIVFEVKAGTKAPTTIATFNQSNGWSPQSALVADAAGNLYGTTQYGGAGGYGTVFEVAAGTHAITDLVAFNDANGAHPQVALTIDAAGNLYGATSGFGYDDVDGTVFKVAAGTHALTRLAAFNGTNGAAANPLYRDAAGDLYGTTNLINGNTGTGGPAAKGTLFEIPARTGVLTTLVTFNGANGSAPSGPLTADAAGNLYGATGSGGTAGSGTLFEVPAGTATLTTLASFDQATTGDDPVGRIAVDAAGDLFGTTFTAGPGDTGSGTVYELAAGSHTPTVLAHFVDSNGGGPLAGLVADAAGNLYGTTYRGGATGHDDGTVFEVTGSGYVVGPQPVAVAAGQAYAFPANPGVGVYGRTVPGVTVAAGGTAAVPVAGTHANRQLLVVTGPGLSLAGTAGAWTGTLDVGDNDADLPSASLATVTGQVAQGYAGGTWNGPGGIVSTSAAADPTRLTALGVIQNSQGGTPLYTSAHPFDGTTPGTGDVLVKYTYYGDANLDGVVNGADYGRIDAGYNSQATGTPLTGWYNGDFNYDGKVDGSDYTLIDNAFNDQGPSLSPSAIVAGTTSELAGVDAAAVPEPATFGVLAAAVVGLLGRRRQRV